MQIRYWKGAGISVHPISNGHINLLQQRKRAKELLQRLKAGLEPEKLVLLHRLNPTSDVTLASAQWLIARDVGFESWPKLKAHVDAIAFARRHPQFAADDVTRRFDEEQAQWQRLPDAEHAVLWCEANPYDQLFLIRTLSTLEKTPKKLELIAVDTIPGVKRFIGLGQLSPDVLA